MFGREYKDYSDILLSSFRQMNEDYGQAKAKKRTTLQKLYLTLFGIPEIGFQIRCLYFSEIINDFFTKQKPAKILDAGSGVGLHTFWLAKKYKDAEVIGGEIDSEKIKFSKKYARENEIENVRFEYFDVTKKNKKLAGNDLIVCVDVLEHIKDYKTVLNNFGKLLKLGGYLYIHTPQPNQKRIFKLMKEWEHDDHLHEGYKPEELKRELKKIGFNIIVLKETYGFFGKLAWELNHISFRKGFIVAGFIYPVLYFISLFDILSDNKNGLGTAVLAQKVKNGKEA